MDGSAGGGSQPSGLLVKRDREATAAGEAEGGSGAAQSAGTPWGNSLTRLTVRSLPETGSGSVGAHLQDPPALMDSGESARSSGARSAGLPQLEEQPLPKRGRIDSAKSGLCFAANLRRPRPAIGLQYGGNEAASSAMQL